MSAQLVIDSIVEKYGEWIEMTPDPAMFVAGILAEIIIKQQENIIYLERRIAANERNNRRRRTRE